MKALTTGRLRGFVVLVNTFLPIIVVVALILMIQSTASSLSYRGCATASRMAAAFADEKMQQAYLDAEGDAQRFAALEALSVTPAERLQDGSPWTPHSACLGKALHVVVGAELFGRAVESIEKQTKVVGSRVSGMKKNLTRRIPDARAWELDHVAKSGVGRALAGGVNDAIDQINKVPSAMRSWVVKLGNNVSDTVVWIFAPLSVVDYQRAATWVLVGGFLTDAAGMLGKFYWFFLALGIWLLASYALWVRCRVYAALALLRGGEAV